MEAKGGVGLVGLGVGPRDWAQGGGWGWGQGGGKEGSGVATKWAERLGGAWKRRGPGCSVGWAGATQSDGLAGGIMLSD